MRFATLIQGIRQGFAEHGAGAPASSPPALASAPDARATSPVGSDTEFTFPTGTFTGPERSELPQPLPAGTRISRYLLEAMIAQTGTATIYSARHKDIDVHVAIKILHPHLREVAGDAFAYEATALARMIKARVTQIHDAGAEGEHSYIVMERLEGRSLAAVLDEHRIMSPSMVLDMLEQVCGVLVEQERLGILHLDLKPENIWQRSDGSYCVLDYGIGADVDGGGLRGPDARPLRAFTPRYAAPEQLDPDARESHRSDLFSLGLSAWQALVGELPPVFDDDRPSRPEVPPVLDTIGPQQAVEEDGAPRLDVAPEIASLVDGMTRSDPLERYGSAREALRELERYRYQGEAPRAPVIGSVFVAMPFRPVFEPVFATVARVCRKHRLEARRMDRIVMVSDIWRQIVQEIDSARIVIADFSPSDAQNVNPNVATEAAHARAIDKPIILLTHAKPEQVPFDWRHHQFLSYSIYETNLEQLEEQLDAQIGYVMRNRD